MEDFVHNVRLELNYADFLSKPISTIHHLLSPNAVVLSYVTNSVVSWNDTIPVDVSYTTIPIDPVTIYYVSIDSLKKLIPDSTKYVTRVEGCYVKITNPQLNMFKEYLPIKIIPILSENEQFDNYYQLESDNENKHVITSSSPAFINYMGKPVTNPLSNYCTALLSQLHEFNLPKATKLYTKEPTLKYYTFTKEQTIENYKKKLSAFDILNIVDNVVYSDKFPSLNSPPTTAYVMPFSAFDIKQDINGIIMIQSDRLWNLVLYYPHSSFIITSEHLNSINNLLEYDYTNLLNINHIRK